MKAVDTNVLARVFVDDPDDPEHTRQRPAAVRAMSEAVFVPATVVLEFEWVLRGFYELPRPEILRALRALVGLRHVSFDDREAIVSALDAYESGFDLADALHLVLSRRGASFVTFDRGFARKAARAGLEPPVELLRSGR